MSLEAILYFLPGFIVGLTVHEAAHAISAKWLGDRNAERMGRVSLNPFRHLSPLGTIALYFLNFGWGKPVIINLYNFKKPKLYYLLSSLAGPFANVLICFAGYGLLFVHMPEVLKDVIRSMIIINAVLAVINLVPIPPLDGSKIWPCLIPGLKPSFSGQFTYIWLAIVFLAISSGAIDRIILPVIRFIAQMLPK
jgi:Zn-dependent protease